MKTAKPLQDLHATAIIPAPRSRYKTVLDALPKPPADSRRTVLDYLKGDRK